MLRALKPEELLGEPTDGGLLLWETHSDSVSVSQCQFTGQGSARTIGLLLRWSADGKAPAGREAVIDEVRAGDALGVGAETAAALEAGSLVEGAGDLALAYELLGHNVMLWKGRYQATVTVTGDGGNALATSVAKQVAGSL
ncbi:MAG: hypothetical protein R3176_02380 [Woeseiaceae bacterium]|nr:hypothetical protein [Woeseiaceae bacterium]